MVDALQDRVYFYSDSYIKLLEQGLDYNMATMICFVIGQRLHSCPLSAFKPAWITEQVQHLPSHLSQTVFFWTESFLVEPL